MSGGGGGGGGGDGETEMLSVGGQNDSLGTPVPGGKSEGGGGQLLDKMLSWGVRAEQGRRKSMEDEHVISEIHFQDSRPEFRGLVRRGALICVFDGHNGPEASAVAAEVFKERLLASPLLSAGDIRGGLQAAFAGTEREILARSQKEGWKGGSTAVVCLILPDDPDRKAANIPNDARSASGDSAPSRKPRKGSSSNSSSPRKRSSHKLDDDEHREPVMWVANCGDSEAVLGNRYSDTSAQSSQSKKNKDRLYIASVTSHAHKLTDPNERSRVEAAGGRVVRDRLFGNLSVARSFGDIEFKYPFNNGAADWVSADPFIVKCPLVAAHAFCIISCDGLWEKLQYEPAVRYVGSLLKSKSTSTETIARELVRQGIEQGSRDNVTGIVVVFEPSLLANKLRPKSKPVVAQTTTSPNPLFGKVGLSASRPGSGSSSPSKSKAARLLSPFSSKAKEASSAEGVVHKNPLLDSKLKSRKSSQDSKRVAGSPQLEKRISSTTRQHRSLSIGDRIRKLSDAQSGSSDHSPLMSPKYVLSPTRKIELDTIFERLRTADDDSGLELLGAIVLLQAHARRRAAQKLLAEMRQLEKARRATLKVIVASVGEYLEKMRLLVDVYLYPLKQHLAVTAGAGASKRKIKSIVDAAELTYIFPTPALEVITDKTENLLAKLNQVLHTDMLASVSGSVSTGKKVRPGSKSRSVDASISKRKTSGLTVAVTPHVGGIFKEFSQYVSEYRRYISDYLNLSAPTLQSLRDSNSRFVQWERLVSEGDRDGALRILELDDAALAATNAEPTSAKKIQAAASSGWLNLDALLRRPVEHLPMLTQLLQQLCVATWDEHSDSVALNNALRELSTVDRFISDVRTLRGVRQRLTGKNVDGLGLDESGRRFIKEGAMVVSAESKTRTGGVEYYVSTHRRSSSTSADSHVDYVFLFDNQLVATRVDSSKKETPPSACVVQFRLLLEYVHSIVERAGSIVILDSFGIELLHITPIADDRHMEQEFESWARALRDVSAQFHRAASLAPPNVVARRTDLKRRQDARRRSRNSAAWDRAMDTAASLLGTDIPNFKDLKSQSSVMLPDFTDLQSSEDIQKTRSNQVDQSAKVVRRVQSLTALESGRREIPNSETKPAVTSVTTSNNLHLTVVMPASISTTPVPVTLESSRTVGRLVSTLALQFDLEVSEISVLSPDASLGSILLAEVVGSHFADGDIVQCSVNRKSSPKFSPKSKASPPKQQQVHVEDRPLAVSADMPKLSPSITKFKTKPIPVASSISSSSYESEDSIGTESSEYDAIPFTAAPLIGRLALSSQSDGHSSD